MSNGLKWMQEVSIDMYDYETCCRKLNIRGYGRYLGIRLSLGSSLFGCLTVGLPLLIMHLEGTTIPLNKLPGIIFFFAVVMLPILIWSIYKVCCK